MQIQIDLGETAGKEIKMKLLKMFGLATMAALVAMAFAGVGSAMAETTGLCEEDPGTGGAEICSGELIEHVHEVTLTGHKAKLLASGFTIECDVLFLGDVDTAGLLGNPLEIHGNLTYEHCNNNCTVVEENGPSLIKVLKLGHETGDVTGQGQVHVECGELIDCKYNGTGLVATAKGPLLSTETNGEVSLSEQVLNRVGGLFCPSTAKLDITTTPTCASPMPVYITK